MTLMRRALLPAVLLFFSFSACMCEPQLTALPQLVIQEHGKTPCEGDAALLQVQAFGGFPPYRYRWEPEDGLSNPNSPQTWAKPGIDSYEVFVSDSMGRWTSQVVEIQPRPRPTPHIEVSRANAMLDDQGSPVLCAGDSFELSAAQSVDADGEPVSKLRWSIPGQVHDGSKQEKLEAVEAKTTQTVELWVQDSMGCEARLERELPVRALPALSLSLPAGSVDLCQGSVVELAAQAVDANGEELSDLAWDLDGDPSSFEVSGASSGPFEAFTGEIRVRASDAYGCTQTRSQTLVAHDLPRPKISFAQGASHMCQGDRVAFHGKDSLDVYGQPVIDWEWEIDDGIHLRHWQGQSPPSELLEGNSTLSLKVSDVRGCAASVSQKVRAQPLPTLAISVEEGASDACALSKVSLSAAGSDAQGEALTSFQWEVNGQPAGSSPHLPALNPVSDTQVRVVGSDALGCQASASLDLTPKALPQAVISLEEGEAEVCAGEQVNLSAASSNSQSTASDALRYFWEFEGENGLESFEGIEEFAGLEGVEWGEGEEGIARFESVEPQLPPFALKANAQVHLRVVDAEGCEHRDSLSLAARPLPEVHIDFEQGESAVCAGSEVLVSGSRSTDAEGNRELELFWERRQGDEVIASAEGELPPFAVDADQQLRLRVRDQRGCVGEKELELLAYPLPQAQISFASGHESSCQGELIQLSASNSSAADGSSLGSYFWELGESGPSYSGLEPNPFVADEAQKVRLRVSDERGCSASTEQWINPRPLPFASIVFEEGHPGLCQGEPLVLSASASMDADGQAPTSFEWDLNGDGNADSFQRDPPPFIPEGAGNVSLKVVDSQGCFASTTVSVEPRKLPTPHLTFLKGRPNVCVGDSVELGAAGSLDADGNPVSSWDWDLSGSGTVEVSGPSSGEFVPTASTATLWVSDAKGCTAKTTQALSPRALPNPVLSFVSGGSQLCLGEGARLSAAGSLDADGQPVSAYAWDLDGDGIDDHFGANSGLITPQQDQTIKLTVSDHLSCSASVEESLSVRELPNPQYSLVGRDFVCGGDPVRLDGSSSTDAEGNPVSSYAWSISGDPSRTDSTQPVTHSFIPQGEVSLRVGDGMCQASTQGGVPIGGPRSLFELGGQSSAHLKSAVDLILVVDNSLSMAPFIQATEDAINQHFAAILEAQGLDYRVIVISAHGSSANERICIRSPLSGTTCRPRIPTRPALTSRFFHYDLLIGSRDGFNKVLESYNKRDIHGFAPNGWSQWLRPGVKKVFIEITDDDSTMSSQNFDNALRALSRQHFGTAAERNYVWHGIFGMTANTPPSEPFLPSQPLVNTRCSMKQGRKTFQATRAGTERQKLSRMTGGLRFSICRPNDFDNMFERLAADIIETVRVDCEFDLSEVEDLPDLSSIAVEYSPGPTVGGPVELLLPVSGPAECDRDSFYLEGELAKLCPQACSRIRTDSGANLALSGCHAP